MKHVIPFLKKLKKNNNKAWFDENRALYESAKGEVEALVTDLIPALGEVDPTIAHLTPKDCMFRINRDVRFSKDKSPYKTNFGISITSGGKKSPLAGYYLHIEPGESFAGGGLWMPPPLVLAAVRQEIDYNYQDLRKILQSGAFKKHFEELYKGDDISLQRVPKGYESDNPAADVLKLKSYLSMKPLPDEDITSGGLVKTAVSIFKALKPMLDFLNNAQT